MKTKNVVLMLVTLFSAQALIADAGATDALFVAIEHGNIQEVNDALSFGADVDFVRSEDGHSARSLATEKLLACFEKPCSPLLPSIAVWALPVAAFMHNTKHTLMSLASSVAGTALSISQREGITETLKKFYVDKALSYAGTAGILATAWSSDKTVNRVISSVGTAGLLLLLYQGYSFTKWQKIHEAVNKQELLLPMFEENMQAPISDSNVL